MVGDRLDCTCRSACLSELAAVRARGLDPAACAACPAYQKPDPELAAIETIRLAVLGRFIATTEDNR